MASVTDLLARRLKLTVNADKSAVDRPAARAFLGLSITDGPTPKRRIAPQTLARFKARVREMMRCTKSVSLAQLVAELSRYLIGWWGYFGFCDTTLGAVPPRPMGQTEDPRHRLAARQGQFPAMTLMCQRCWTPGGRSAFPVREEAAIQPALRLRSESVIEMKSNPLP